MHYKWTSFLNSGVHVSSSELFLSALFLVHFAVASSDVSRKKGKDDKMVGQLTRCNKGISLFIVWVFYKIVRYFVMALISFHIMSWSRTDIKWVCSMSLISVLDQLVIWHGYQCSNLILSPPTEWLSELLQTKY